MPDINDPLQQYNNKVVTVYKLKNTITGKIYVGVTQNTIEQRFKAHVNAKNAKLRNKQRLPYFLRSLHKYGENVWEKEQLCKCDNIEEAYQKEIYFINKLNSFGKNGYNSTIGGEGCHGRVMTDKQKENLRQNRIGVKASDAARQKMSQTRRAFWGSDKSNCFRKLLSIKALGANNPFYGKHHTEETKQKIREKQPNSFGINNTFYGRHHTEETKQKIRENLPDKSGTNNPFYGRHHTEETKQKMQVPRPSISGDKHYTRKYGVSQSSIEKMRATKIKNGTHAGAKNIKACRCKINGVQYGCIKDACGELSMTEKQIRYRLDSDKYSNFIRI